MTNPIQSVSISGVPMPTKPLALDAGAKAGQPSFTEVLSDSIQQVNGMQAEADQAIQQLATGGDVNPAEVLSAVQKADLAFRLMMQIRNKLVQAYQEVQNIRV